MKRLLFYYHHVLGMGHLVRSMEIVRSLKDFDVCFLNGGEMGSGIMPAHNVRFVSLPALNSDWTSDKSTLPRDSALAKSKLMECARPLSSSETW